MKFMTKKWYLDLQKTSKPNRTFMIENIGKFNEHINLQDVFENLCRKQLLDRFLNSDKKS